VAEKNKQLNAEQKRLQQELESYARQNFEREEKMRTALQQLDVVEKQKLGKKPFFCKVLEPFRML
jgi:hypothetical protein